jgi:hypothetical protein
MSIETIKLTQLQCTFPKLTEANQHYVLGLAEGLKRAQGGKVGEKVKEEKANGMVKRG